MYRVGGLRQPLDDFKRLGRERNNIGPLSLEVCRRNRPQVSCDSIPPHRAHRPNPLTCQQREAEGTACCQSLVPGRLPDELDLLSSQVPIPSHLLCRRLDEVRWIGLQSRKSSA